jgi:hypothetical protein
MKLIYPVLGGCAYRIPMRRSRNADGLAANKGSIGASGSRLILSTSLYAPLRRNCPYTVEGRSLMRGGDAAGESAYMSRTVRNEAVDYRVPDCVEAVVGWRSWVATRDGDAVRLCSPLYGTVWPVGREAVAACSQPALPGHLAPSERCNCGIYAGGSVADATRLDPPGTIGASPVPQRVIGRVALWGKVVECDGGWRAERGYPTHIYVPLATSAGGRVSRTRARRRAERVAHALQDYGVPVDVVACEPDELAVLAEEDERRSSNEDR